MDKIKTTIENLVKIMGFNNFTVDLKEEETSEDQKIKKIVRINLQIDEDASLLIGYRGTNLSSFQYILRLIAQKQFDPSVIISLELNGYRQQREEYLKTVAKKAARQVILTKSSVELEPMNSMERRIIHNELAAYPELTTQSRGEGENRRVAVLPL